MNWYLKVLKDYTNFNGRARRTEYWMFVLFNIIFAAVAMFLDNMLGLIIDETFGYGYIYLAYGLLVLIPGIAVVIRRLHDTGKSGWWILLSFIPLIGTIWLLILLVTAGDEGPNAYGPDPKAIAAV